MKVKSLKNHKSGQMLIETLFALTVVVIVLVALMTAAVVSIKNARYSRNMILANHYVQQAIENTRAYRNRNKFDDLTNCATEREEIEGTIFQRKIEIDDESQTDRKKITATISWSDSNCGPDNLCKAEIVTYLSRWEN